MIDQHKGLTSPDGITYRLVPLEWIIPNPENYNQHPREQIDALKADFKRFGQVKPYVVKQQDETTFMLSAGEGCTIAAGELLEEDAKRYSHLATAKIVVVPDSWTDDDVIGFMAADNETARMSVPDEERLIRILQRQQEAGYDLRSLGSDEEALRQMLANMGEETIGYSEGAGGDDFDTTPDEGPTLTHVGQLWQLGKHRLLVGDSTKREDVERLMQGEKASLVITSPPYFNQRPEYAIFRSYEDYNQFLSRSLDNIIHVAGHPFILAWNTGDNQQDNLPMIADQTVQIRTKGLTYIEMIIWCKSGAVYSNPRNMHVRTNHYFYPALAYEPIIIFRKGDTMPKFDVVDEDRVSEFAVDVWDINQVIGSEQEKIGHPAIFPLELPTRVMLAYSRKNDICFEPFGGSGTTLIGAQRTGRKAYLMEIEPKYADVVLRRFTAETGIEPELLERLEVVS